MKVTFQKFLCCFLDFQIFENKNLQLYSTIIVRSFKVCIKCPECSIRMSTRHVVRSHDDVRQHQHDVNSSSPTDHSVSLVLHRPDGIALL